MQNGIHFIFTRWGVELKKRLILVIFLILLFGVSALVYWGQRSERIAELYYSGTIDATQANLAFQVSGRVSEVFFEEGQAVKKSQLLAVLEQDEFMAHRDQAHSEENEFCPNPSQTKEKGIPFLIRDAYD